MDERKGDMTDDIVTQIQEHDELLYYLRQAASFIEVFPKMAVRECIPRESLIQAADEIERLRKRNNILFDALRALTNGKSMYFTESLGRTVTMDAQNSWMETPDD